MAIDRVLPTNPALTVHEQMVRVQPSQALPVPPVQNVPAKAPDFNLPQQAPAVPAVLAEAADLLAQPGHAAAAAAGVASAQSLLAGESAAMLPNQLLARQIVWHAPDPNIMAMTWQVMVRTYGEQRAAMQEQAQGKHLPGSLFLADPRQNTLREHTGLPFVSEMDAWRFAVYAWGAEKLVLRVVAREPGPASETQRRRRVRVALRLELHLHELGKVVIQMEPAGASVVVLEIGAAQTAAMQYMREMLPHIASIASHCGLSILRARLMRELPLIDAANNNPNPAQVMLLTPPLFKAMADIAVMLSQPPQPELHEAAAAPAA
ncbi:hypothetical protein [Pseudoduganella violacea]|uniref:Flagellar hook-length control protein FliK n=1 Tax=Pseudoduganella violacea TaxID=1715466 RepID=A0A7W5BDB8_9BURK|nr:hypothetical protein [Pseudoduganella violacea]MBB3120843.1 hypothetical protein [Pseudoduganella violacea]